MWSTAQGSFPVALSNVVGLQSPVGIAGAISRKVIP